MRKFLKHFLRWTLIIILVLIGLLYLTDNQYILRGLKLTYFKGYTTANIDDYKDFDNRIVLHGTPQPWEAHPNYGKVELTDTLRRELERFETAGFGIFKDGKWVYDEYWMDYNARSKTNSFSMAKSMVSMLLFAAIEDGYIKGIEQPITDFLPEYQYNPFAMQTTIGDLSAMTAGYDWREDYYLPLNPTAKAYYGADIEKQILDRTFIRPSGGHFKYLSGVTQLLGIVIERATNKRLSDYLSEKFWQPLGMEEDALWSTDGDNKMEKAYCCVNSNVRDFAKLGQLLLNQGNWNGKQLLDSAHVKKMVTPNYKAFNEGESAIYGYSIWTDYEHKPQFYAMLGHLGQRIICIPSENLVIVRLGRKKDQRPLNLGPLPGTDIYYYVDEVMKMVGKEITNSTTN